MPIYENEYPVPVTGSVFVINQSSGSGAGGNVNITGTITLPVTATQANPIWVTGSTGGSSDINITGSITLPVSMSNPVTASVSNFPADQVVHGNVNITASVALPVTSSGGNPVLVTGSVFVINSQGSNVNITGSITLPVSMSNPVTASIANFPAGFNVNVTASVTQSITGTVHLDNTTVGVSMSNVPVTQSVTWAQGLPVTASISNFPLTQSVKLDQTITVPVSATNPVTASIANFPTGFNVNVTASVTQSVTGTVHIDNTTVGVSMSNVPATQSVTWAQGLPVTASISNFPTTFPGNVNITGSITVPVSATNPVTASIANFPTGFNTNITASIPLFVTASVPGLTASISNLPVTQSVKIDQSITVPVSMTNAVLTASIGNFPTGFNSNITASITLPVTSTVANPVWVTSSVTTPVNAKIVDATGADMDLFKDGDNLAIGSDHGLAILAVADGAPRKYHFLKTDPTNNYLWVTGSVLVNTGSSSGGGVQYGTGSATFLTGTLFLASGTTGGALPLKVDAAGQLYIANPGGAAAPTSGTVTSIAATGTVGGVLLKAANANRKGATIFNNASTNLYVSLGTSATTTSFQVLIVPTGYYEMPFTFTGDVSGAWSGTPTGNALFGENI